jgi:Uma2 family endonuclease
LTILGAVPNSSLDKDLHIKRKMVAEVGIREYWIVDCQSRDVHVFRDPEQGDYQYHVRAVSPELVGPLAAPTAMLNLRELFEGE